MGNAGGLTTLAAGNARAQGFDVVPLSVAHRAVGGRGARRAGRAAGSRLGGHGRRPDALRRLPWALGSRRRLPATVEDALRRLSA